MEKAKIGIDLNPWLSFLGKIKANAVNANKFIITAANTMGFKNIIQHFRDESGPQGRWQPRAESTQITYGNIMSGKWKPRGGTGRGYFNPSNKLLSLTNMLRQSLLPGKGQIKEKGKNSVLLSSNVGYSGVHDEGGKNMPQREFMWLSDDTRSSMAQMIASLILENA